MRTEYPTYDRGELRKVFSKLPQSERKIIEDFISYCSIGAKPNKLEDMKRSIVQFRDVIKANFDDITLTDLREYLSLLNKSNRMKYTTNGIKTHLKKFLRWKFKDWSSRFNELKDIRTQKAFNHKRINEGVLITKEEIDKIMKAEPRIFWKTFFITLYQSGVRPIELRFLKWKDINFNVDGDLSEIHIYSTKTGASRAIYVKEATAYLQKLREKGLQSDFVFPSSRRFNEPLNKATISIWLKNLSKKAIGREIFPYLLRHSRATELYLENPKVACKFMGHSKDMSDLYTHLSSKDVKDSLLKTVYKLEEDLPPEKKAELEKRIEEQERKIKEIDADRQKWAETAINVLNKMNKLEKARPDLFKAK